MAEQSLVITLPVVTSAAFSLNPVQTTGLTEISVKVEEQTKTLYPEAKQIGEFNTGEV